MEIVWRLLGFRLRSGAMIYQFADFELDTDRVELREKGVVIAMERQVFALLRLLVENSGRTVTTDEIVENVWTGRAISNSAISSRVKSARKALGDDGRAQALIRTIHSVGFSFVADVTARTLVRFPSQVDAISIEPGWDQRPRIAVVPFCVVGMAQPQYPIADALPHDLITELSRLHWLFVIARGSSFRFRGRDASLEEVRQKLNVQYCLAGTVEISGKIVFVSVELSDTRDNRIVWSERFRAEIAAIHEVRDHIVRAVIGAVEVRIPVNEARRASLKSPENLDAWSAYHLGLHHMYRFNKADNDAATHLFERAVAMEPGFARAYAGLSFTHFQSAFLRYTNDSQSAMRAQRAAFQCLERDPLDPFGHFTMGRAHWLRGDLEASLPWLERANDLNPNYAQARYSRGWVEALLGHAEASQSDISAALVLSPLDPLVYGMLGVRALSYLVLSDAAQAVVWAEMAANSPGAHALIEMIAVTAHGLNGDDLKAKQWAQSVRSRAAHLNKEDFLRAFPIRDAHTQVRIKNVLNRLGF